MTAHTMPWPLIVGCDRHGLAPYSFCCEHLLLQPRQDWYAMLLAPGDAREVTADWMCRDCVAVFEAITDLALNPWDYLQPLLVPMCINCLPEPQGQGNLLVPPLEAEDEEEDA